jgi:hypothetical protein
MAATPTEGARMDLQIIYVRLMIKQSLMGSSKDKKG